MKPENYTEDQTARTRDGLKERERDEAAHISRITQTLEFFDKYSDKSLPALDVGCSNGIFLDVMKMRGYKDLHGIDISEDAVKIAVKKGHDCVVHDIHEPYDGHFGTVILTHVLEHCYNPILVLINIVDLMDRYGTLLLEVPFEPEPESIPTKWGHFYTFQDANDYLALVGMVNGLKLEHYIEDKVKHKWIRGAWTKT